ncbi:MAG: thiamine-phosphate kinase [Candidatus Nitrosocosmicus sp.]
MKRFDEKQILALIMSKMDVTNMEPLFGKDDISLIPLNKVIKKSNKEYSLAITCDMLVEHTDIPPKMTFKQIARKSLVSCISDLSTKGIQPVIALTSLGIPRYLNKWNIDDIVKGFSQTSKEFGFFIIGGDINQSKELIIDCYMLGFSNNNSNVPRRNGAVTGDYVIVSGPFGYSSSGLKILLNNLKSPNYLFKKKSINSVLNPFPPVNFGLKLSQYLSSSIDSSDGLALSLYELAKESKVDILIYKDKIPIPSELQKFSIINNLDLDDLIFYGGEEYHVVGTIAKKNLSKVDTLVKKYCLDFFIIGRVIKGIGKVFVECPNKQRKLLKNKGFTHLS